MKFETDIFKAYDIRGKHHQLSVELGEYIGFAVVKKTGARSLLVGRDMRETSDDLAEAVARGANLAGAKVLDIGLCTTSLYNFALINSDEVEAGVMITASHNPAEYNGFKMNFADGQPISGLEIKEMIDELGEIESEEVQDNVEEVEVLEDYMDFLVEAVELPADLSELRIVADFGNGMGGFTLSPLFERLGIEVIEMYKELDATFPNHEANPAKAETLEDVKKKVLETEADFGIATDGDGDRIAFIDNKGRHLRGDQILAILVSLLAENFPDGKVVVQPNFGRAGLEMIEGVGYEMVESRIGRNFVIKAMKESGAIVGGESSAHFFYEATEYLESIDYTFLLILLAWLNSGQTFAEMVEDLFKYVNTGEINFEIEDKEAVLTRIEEAFAEEAVAVNKLDGVRVEFADWWFIARPSNTEPVIRVTVEAESEELATEKVAILRKLIEG